MGKFYYFQAPSLDIDPESGTAPKLGSIFAKLDHLVAPLNQHENLTIPQDLLNRNVNSNFSEARTCTFKTQVGLNATVPWGAAGSADLVYAFSHARETRFQCDLLETVEFVPDIQFVTDSIVASRRVQTFLDNSLFGRKRVYMITGLKIASGLRRFSSTEDQHNPDVKLAASGALSNVPITAGPNFGLTIRRGRSLAYGETLNKIVFAYKVIRVKVKWDGEARYKYKTGGKYAVDDDSDDSDEENTGNWVMESLNEEDRLKDFPELVKVEVQTE